MLSLKQIMSNSTVQRIIVDPSSGAPPTRDMPTHMSAPPSLPGAKETKVHPSNAGGENASLFFVGTATTILYVLNLPHIAVADARTGNGQVCGL